MEVPSTECWDNAINQYLALCEGPFRYEDTPDYNIIYVYHAPEYISRACALSHRLILSNYTLPSNRKFH